LFFFFSIYMVIFEAGAKEADKQQLG
jgi:hypothetical protein